MNIKVALVLTSTHNVVSLLRDSSGLRDKRKLATSGRDTFSWKSEWKLYVMLTAIQCVTPTWWFRKLLSSDKCCQRRKWSFLSTEHTYFWLLGTNLTLIKEYNWVPPALKLYNGLSWEAPYRLNSLNTSLPEIYLKTNDWLKELRKQNQNLTTSVKCMAVWRR